MNRDQVEGSVKRIRGMAKEKWGRLIGDDTIIIAGLRERLEGCLQERYGYGKDPAHDDTKQEEEGYWRTLNANVDSAFGDLRIVIEDLPTTSGSGRYRTPVM